MYRNPAALVFSDYTTMKYNETMLDALRSILGTKWTRPEVEAMFRPDRRGEYRRTDEISIPLAFWLNPHAQDFLESVFGAGTHPDWVEGEVVEGINMDRAEFIKIASMFAPLTRGAGVH